MFKIHFFLSAKNIKMRIERHSFIWIGLVFDFTAIYFVNVYLKGIKAVSLYWFLRCFAGVLL